MAKYKKGIWGAGTDMSCYMDSYVNVNSYQAEQVLDCYGSF
jgi:hypothetical protein